MLQPRETSSGNSTDVDPGIEEEEPGQSSPAPTPTAAIVGGAVGSFIGLTMVGAFIWFIARRRRLRAHLVSSEAPEGDFKAVQPPQSEPQSDRQAPPAELAYAREPRELRGDYAHELVG